MDNASPRKPGSSGSVATSAEEKGPALHPVDRQVGQQIRLRRKALHISQERLAEALGLTFQQVQKYERGDNRVSASRLWEIARALNTSVARFYDGLEGESGAQPRGVLAADIQHYLRTPEGLELATAFPRIREPRLRRKLLELVRALVDTDPVKTAKTR